MRKNTLLLAMVALFTFVFAANAQTTQKIILRENTPTNLFLKRHGYSSINDVYEANTNNKKELEKKQRLLDDKRREYSTSSNELQSIKQEYQTLALQLLDLMHTLHMRASQIYKQIPTDQTISSVLWYKCWCPILQGQLFDH